MPNFKKKEKEEEEEAKKSEGTSSGEVDIYIDIAAAHDAARIIILIHSAAAAPVSCGR